MRISRLLSLPLLTLLLLARPTSAASLNPDAIPADTIWLIHLDVDQLRASSAWSTLKEKFTGTRRAEFDTRIQQLDRLTGLKLPEDLHDVTLYSSDFSPQTAVLLLHANLNQSRVTTFLSRNPDFHSTPYHGHDILTWKERMRDRIVYGSFANDSLAVVAPTEDLVKSALDSLDTPPNTPVRGSSVENDYKPNTILFLAANDITKLRRPDAPNRAQSPLLDQIDSASLTLSENNHALDTSITISTKSDKIADRLNRFIDGLKASNSLAMSDPDPSARAKILDVIFPSLKTTIDGTTLHITCSLTTTDIENLLHQLASQPHPLRPNTTQP